MKRPFLRIGRGANLSARNHLKDVQLDDEVLDDLAVTTYYTREEIAKLFRRFLLLTEDDDQKLTPQQFFAMPELAYNQMRSRLEVFWADDMSDGISFSRFVRLLAPFASGCPRDQKFRFAFRVQDADEDGQIGESDLRGIIASLLGTSRPRAPEGETADGRLHGDRQSATVAPQDVVISRHQVALESDANQELIDKIVASVYEEVDFNDDRTISFEEWVRVVANTDIVSKLTFNL
jgi:serine/threonine-protein phosphatase 2B regulatory subunit